METVEQRIARLDLKPHPEGGWYREIHRSPILVQRPDGALRNGLTVILFLLAKGETSRWHRVSGADEVWAHAGGDPLELSCIPPQGGPTSRIVIGAGHQPVAVAPAGHWQAARSLGAWSLVSCCVGPGFDFADFALLADLPSQDHPAGADPTLL
jgi:predicted cupin superfamily sugar epimerase